MQINRKKIRSVNRYLAGLPRNGKFRIVVNHSQASQGSFERCGFSSDKKAGETILPSIVGNVTKRNAEGSWLIQRHLPKERRYIYTRSWTREQWAGRNQTESVESDIDYFRDCYPRKFIEPKAVELTFQIIENVELISSPELVNSEENIGANAHVINMMLELFKSCEIVSSNYDSLNPPETKRLNWLMLPPGVHPWEKVKEHIELFAKKQPESVVKVILERQAKILEHLPTAVYQGHAGFGDYLAYIFEAKSMVVLESIFYGNALYILGQDWASISRMSKAEIIRNGLQDARIVHTKGWDVKLAAALR